MRASFIGLGLIVIMIISAACSDVSTRAMVGQPSNMQQQALKAGMRQLNVLADQLYTAANEGNRQIAFAALLRFERAVKDKLLRETGHPDGWNALEQSVAAAKKTLDKSQGKGAFVQASRIKLAVDALQQQSPLWLQYRTVLQDDIVRARRMPPAGAVALMELFGQHLDRIEAAVLMDRPKEQLEQLQEQLKNTKQVMRYAIEDSSQTHLVNYALLILEQSANALFMPPAAAGDAKTASAVPVKPVGKPIPARELLMTMFIASLVMGVLGFVGWRKFKLEQTYGTAIPPAEPPHTRHY